MATPCNTPTQNIASFLQAARIEAKNFGQKQNRAKANSGGCSSDFRL
jgi:hypothetical protein